MTVTELNPMRDPFRPSDPVGECQKRGPVPALCPADRERLDAVFERCRGEAARKWPGGSGWRGSGCGSSGWRGQTLAAVATERTAEAVALVKDILVA